MKKRLTLKRMGDKDYEREEKKICESYTQYLTENIRENRLCGTGSRKRSQRDKVSEQIQYI